MSQTPHIFASARQQLDQLALGQVSAADLLEEHIARSGIVNPVINAVVRTSLDAARERARELDRLLKAGIPAGPLHGLPICIKDIIDGVYSAESQARQGKAEALDEKQLAKRIKETEKAMMDAARDLRFEDAARLRDSLRELKQRLFGEEDV